MKCGGLDRYTRKACRFRLGHRGDCLSAEPRFPSTSDVEPSACAVCGAELIYHEAERGFAGEEACPLGHLTRRGGP